MGTEKKWCPQGSILGHLFFSFLYYDLPKIINIDANIIFFADDTSILVPNPNKTDFIINSNQAHGSKAV